MKWITRERPKIDRINYLSPNHRGHRGFKEWNIINRLFCRAHRERPEKQDKSHQVTENEFIIRLASVADVICINSNVSR